MASTCISNCVNDARAPVRATYVNLYKWPESDVEFVRSLSSNSRESGTSGHPKVVDSISCRQLYLRSYTFSRDECMDEKSKKTSRTRRIREKVAGGNRRKRKSRGGSGSRSSRSSDGGRGKCTGFRRAKEASYLALASICRLLLSCTTKVDVVG